MPAQWERLTGESSKAFAAFSKFRDLDRSQRSLGAAAAIHYRVPVASAGQLQTFKKWSMDFGWSERAAAYDEHLDAAALPHLVDEIVEARRRHAALARTFLEKITDRLEEIDPQAISPGLLVRWLDTAVKVERLSLGDAGQIVETRTDEPSESPEVDRIEEAIAKLTEMRERMSAIEEG